MEQNFPKNKYFLPHDTHTYVCVSGGKNFLFFGIFELFDVLFQYEIVRALFNSFQRSVSFHV